MSTATGQRPTITIALINEIRDDEELTAMVRVMESARQEARWQGFGSDWDMARFSACMLRQAGFGATAAAGPAGEADEPEAGPSVLGSA